MNKTKLSAFLLAAGLSVSGVAAAETFGAAAQAPVQTVAQAKQLADDTNVSLVGHIVKKISHERYEFRDASGSITVEIDDDDWRGLTVNAQDSVRIDGEVEIKRRGGVEIDVDRVVKL